MLTAYLGFVLALGVCIVILLIAWKAQRGIAHRGYQSMLLYDEEAQLMQDKHELHRLGFAQLLRRRLSGISAFGLSFNVMALIGGAAMIYGPALQAGGLTVIAIGLPVVALFSIFVAASIAETSSEMPTSGGICHAVIRQGGRRWGMRAGIYQWLGHLAMLALFIGGTAYLTDSFAARRLGYEVSSYTLWCWSFLVLTSYFVIHTWGSSLLRFLQSSAFWLQLAIAVLIIGGLAWTFWPSGFDPSALYQWRSSEGDGVVQPASFAVGLLLLSKLFLGKDGASQGAEEIVEPRIKVPWAIYLSTGYMYILAFVLLFFMTLILSMSESIPSASASSATAGSGSPFLFLELAGRGVFASSLIQLLILVSLWHSGTQSMSHCSRLLFCLAREGSLPLSEKLGHISASRRIPQNALLVSGLISMLLLLLAREAVHGSALLPLLSLSIICLHLSYGISIGWKLRLFTAKNHLIDSRSARKVEPGPWHLGSWSVVIHLLAVLWLGISILLAIIYLPSFGVIATAGATLLSTALLMRYGPETTLSTHRSHNRGRDREEWSRIERDYSA